MKHYEVMQRLSEEEFDAFCEETKRAAVRRDAVIGGRSRWTVGRIRELIKHLPDDMPVLVSHQPAFQRIGVQDPVVRVAETIAIDSVSDRGVEMYVPTGEHVV